MSAWRRRRRRRDVSARGSSYHSRGYPYLRLPPPPPTPPPCIRHNQCEPCEAELTHPGWAGLSSGGLIWPLLHRPIGRAVVEYMTVAGPCTPSEIPLPSHAVLLPSRSNFQCMPNILQYKSCTASVIASSTIIHMYKSIGAAEDSFTWLFAAKVAIFL